MKTLGNFSCESHANGTYSIDESPMSERLETTRETVRGAVVAYAACHLTHFTRKAPDRTTSPSTGRYLWLG